jgi:hypothetical protein
MTRRRVLIIARTAREAGAHAIVHGFKNWRFVVNPNDLLDINPAMDALAFAGDWRARSDIDELRSRARGFGVRLPL